MKKLFVLLLALSVLAGAAFAQAVVSMYSENYATPFNDAGTNSYDNYNLVTFKWAADDMGMSFVVESATSSDYLATPRNFDIWYNLFDGKAKIYTGDLRQTGDVRLTTFIEGNGFSTRIANADMLSVMLMVKPIDGLVLDVVLPLQEDDFATAVDAFDNLAFGVGYTVTDMVKIVASYRMANEELAIGADLLMVEGLTARLGFKNRADISTNTIYATAGYTMDALTFGLDAYFILDPSTYEFEGQVEYGMDPFAFGVLASYGNAATWFQDGFVLYPYAKMHFSKGDIELGFQLNADNTWSIPLTFYVDM